jgi:hypothetical protein
MRWKFGQIIALTRPHKGGYEKFVADKGQIRIPAHTPCKVLRCTNTTLLVEYEGKRYQMRHIPEREYLATEMGRVLFEP